MGALDLVVVPATAKQLALVEHRRMCACNRPVRITTRRAGERVLSRMGASSLASCAETTQYGHPQGGAAWGLLDKLRRQASVAAAS